MAKEKFGISQSQIGRLGRKLGVGGQRNVIVFARVAEVMGVPPPKSKAEGRQLAARYLNGVDGALPRRQKSGTAKAGYEASDAFLMSYQWRKLRMQVLVKRGAVCECCGASAARDKARMNVDHIKPRRLFPELALDENNLQILCAVCNHGKGNWDQTDWRDEATRPQPVSKVDPTLPRLAPEHRPLWG